MTATIRIPSHNIAYEVDDDAKALHCAVLLRAQYPSVEIIVEISDTPASDGRQVKQDAGPVPRPSHEGKSVTGGDIDLEIPFFLRRTREQTISQ